MTKVDIRTYHQFHVLNVDMLKKNVNNTCEIIDIVGIKCTLMNVYKYFI